MKNQKKRLICIGTGTILLMLTALYEDTGNQIFNKNKNLTRGQPGTGSQDVEMEIEIPELDQTISYQVEVPERTYTEAEREELFEKARVEIDRTFSPEQESMEHITKKVYLPDTLAGGLVQVEWSFGDSMVIEPDGSMQTQFVSENGTPVMVQAQMSYGEYECVYAFACTVYPEEIDGTEALLKRLSQVISANRQKNPDTEELILPKKIGKYTLEWEQGKSKTPLFILLLGAAAAIAVVVLEHEQIRRREEERKRRLQMEYPQLVAKLALLLGAGMTVRQAWDRLNDGYLAQQASGKIRCSELAEQIQVTYRQMREGVSEVQAYEQFGERSGLSLYRRFGMLLVQNLQKGNSGLIAALETEADRAFEERKKNAKKLGEEAGTKLLAPMMFMLAIVIVILMVPAILAMQI